MQKNKKKIKNKNELSSLKLERNELAGIAEKRLSLEQEIESLTTEMQQLIDYFEQNPTENTLRLRFLQLALKRRELKNELYKNEKSAHPFQKLLSQCPHEAEASSPAKIGTVRIS